MTQHMPHREFPVVMYKLGVFLDNSNFKEFSLVSFQTSNTEVSSYELLVQV